MRLPEKPFRTTDQLSRAELCARAYTLRKALDHFAILAELQGTGCMDCVGAVKKTLIATEEAIRVRDRGVLALVSDPADQRATA